MSEAVAASRAGPGTIRARSQTSCPLCGAHGAPLYAALRDTLFGAPGEWSIARCPGPGCGALWLDPRPVEEDLGEAYRAYHTHAPSPPAAESLARRGYHWLKDSHIARRLGYAPPAPAAFAGLLAPALRLFPDRRESAELEVMDLAARPLGQLLDVGCGSGGMMLRMRDRGWRVQGLDFDSAAVEAARGAGLDVRLGSLASQDYAGETFDAVTMSHLIEHVTDPIELLHESHRVLKPGGELVILTPNAASWGHAIFQAAWRGLEPPRHIQIFTPAALRRAVEKAGFRECAVRTSARSRTFIAAESLRTARARARDGGTPFALRASARWFRLTGRARLAVSPASGEEIVLRARA